MSIFSSIDPDLDLEGWAATTLRNSSEFSTYTQSVIGAEFNFVTSPNMRDTDDVELPECTVQAEILTSDDMDANIYNTFWTIPITFAIDDRPIEISGETKRPQETVNNILQYTGSKKVKKCALKAAEVLKERANECPVQGQQLTVVGIEQLYITETGDADDVMAILLLRIATTNQLV